MPVSQGAGHDTQGLEQARTCPPTPASVLGLFCRSVCVCLGQFYFVAQAALLPASCLACQSWDLRLEPP